MLLWLELAIAAAVLVSYLLYLRDRFRTFIVQSQDGWQRARPELTIGEQSASMSYLGKVWEMQLPSVIYLSEFLMVLSFRPEAEMGSAQAVYLVLWPDSLRRSEDRRLRRYLRFDLPTNLLEN
tara:strand:+ start:638 stop:1006 length:369 start_codon:yes stop_codon:yes gene_type:complete